MGRRRGRGPIGLNFFSGLTYTMTILPTKFQVCNSFFRISAKIFGIWTSVACGLFGRPTVLADSSTKLHAFNCSCIRDESQL